MAASAPAEQEDLGYSRKDKSLSTLCERFVQQFGGEYGAPISLDAAAAALQVPRRRIYDVVNILSSVDVISRLAKNTYAWQGLDFCPAAGPTAASGLRLPGRVVGTARGGGRSTPATRERWDKSLAGLTQRFVQLLVDTPGGTLSLHAAGEALASREERADRSKMKTTVRRLYDIANTLSAIGLVAKTACPGSRTPAFRWVGPGAHAAEQQEQAPLGAPTPEPRARPPQLEAAPHAAVLGAEAQVGPGMLPLQAQEAPLVPGSLALQGQAWAACMADAAAGTPVPAFAIPPEAPGPTPPRFCPLPPRNVTGARQAAIRGGTSGCG